MDPPPASAPAPQSDLTWSVVDSADMLRTWALAWDDVDSNAQFFRPELLDDPAVCVLAVRGADGRVLAGAVANRSEQVVGISDLFAPYGGGDMARPTVLGAVHRLYPTLPVVGYERGEYLDSALRHGFK